MDLSKIFENLIGCFLCYSQCYAIYSHCILHILVTMTFGAFAIIYMDFATSFWWFCHHSQYVLESSYVVVSILYLVFCSFDGGMLYLVFHLCGSG